jgi:hypothetical protein
LLVDNTDDANDGYYIAIHEEQTQALKDLEGKCLFKPNPDRIKNRDERSGHNL